MWLWRFDMQRIAYPFLRLSSESFSIEPWCYQFEAGERQPLQRYIPEWDYQQNLQISTSATLDWAGASKESGFSENELSIALYVRVGTGNSNLPRIWIHSERYALNPDNDNIPIHLQVPGNKLSGKIFIQTLIVAESIDGGSDLSAKLPAASLWQDLTVASLEGDAGRFPMEALPFSNIFSGTPVLNAPWYLDYTSGSPSRDFTSAVRLYINTEHKEFFKRIDRGDKTTLQQMMGHVMDIISRDILNMDEVDELDDCEEGSVGAFVWSWLQLIFPGKSYAGIKQIMNITPGRLASVMMTVADLGDDE
jgi:hypothetical protein